MAISENLLTPTAGIKSSLNINEGTCSRASQESAAPRVEQLIDPDRPRLAQPSS